MQAPPYSTRSVYEKLSEEFAPVSLDVIDESEQHRGHGGWREGGHTHYRVVMRCAAFDGKTRIERSRAVHAALRDELASGLHALALELSGERDA
ncbi:BolA family transcriptional regulator [Amaricoccus sp.]|uniref:BolA family protein n=1 Tax=Amaricoccus sp. TaxID=1872485 RepID=UPI001B72B95B|nr:BolA family protein [Amaricoccus sp.]MBP7240569.1 BolA family transcriptional regulator [Amaricoccus sp.]